MKARLLLAFVLAFVPVLAPSSSATAQTAPGISLATSPNAPRLQSTLAPAAPVPSTPLPPSTLTPATPMPGTPLPQSTLAPTAVGSTNQIVFSSAASWNLPHDMYAMNPDGSNVQRINATHSSADIDARVSRDGSKVVFASNATGTNYVYSMDANGSNVRPLAPAEGWANPDWSPNGSLIAYTCVNHGICLMNADGSNVRRLTSTYDTFPRWSHSGTQIAFSSGRSGYWQVYVMNADGTNQQPLTNGLGANDWLPNWSPDDSKIAYTHWAVAYFDSIYVMNANGSGAHALTGTEHNEHPIWSPDGTKIAFNSNRSGQLRNVYVMGADGSNPTRLTTADEVPSDWWAPSKPTVVLVHGWLGFPGQGMDTCSDKPVKFIDEAQTPSGMGLIPARLMVDGFSVYLARLDSGPAYTPLIEHNAACLAQELQYLHDQIGVRSVALVGHSMGGLVARAYLENNNLYRPSLPSAIRVTDLFTLGSPHQGAPAEVLAAVLGPGAVGYCLWQAAACEFSTLGMVYFNWRYSHRASNVVYHLVSGDSRSDQNETASEKITSVLFRGVANDGIVSTASGLGLANIRDHLQTDENHTDLFGPITYFVRGANLSLAYTNCLSAVLVSHSTCGSLGTQAPGQAQAPAAPLLAQHTPLTYGVLSLGQTVTHSISLEGGPTLFAGAWQTGTLALTLVSPSHQVVDPAYAAANPSVVSYTVDAAAATYYFPNAAIGAWQVVQQAISVPAGGTAYSSFAAFDSPVGLTGGTDQGWYAPAAAATITAALTGSPMSATVTAQIVRPDGITDTVTLASVGGGQYGATYIVPNAPGYANVLLEADGLTGSSQPFARGTSLMFQISPRSFTLNGNDGDTRQPRSPGSYYYQALTVTVGLLANISGTVGLAADLTDASNNFVAHSVTSEPVAAGAATLALRFDAADIYASQRNGPYKLTNLLLTDQTLSLLVVGQAENVYTTPAYDYGTFGSGDVYLPVVER